MHSYGMVHSDFNAVHWSTAADVNTKFLRVENILWVATQKNSLGRCKTVKSLDPRLTNGRGVVATTVFPRSLQNAKESDLGHKRLSSLHPLQSF